MTNSVELLWTSDQLDTAIPDTRTTDINYPSGIRTRKPSNPEAAELKL
jgi:hypothetical protein